MINWKERAAASLPEEWDDDNFIWDMHAHLACLTQEQYDLQLAYEELNVRRSQNIAAFFSCGTPQEWEFMQQLMKDRHADQGIRLSFGIHPWYSDRYNPEEYREIFETCDAIGEIGMDSVWCDIPLGQQRKIFERQLQTAADLGKSVVLHTKGQEREIGEMIQDFPGKICVHWYSGEIDSLELYLQKDCYFTLGPDFTWKQEDELYQHMLQRIPDKRLFLETDGLDAVIWAYEELKCGQKAEQEDRGANEAWVIERKWNLLSRILSENLQTISRYKNKKPKEMLLQFRQNLFDFSGL